MQAIMLAAGMGNRLGKHTENKTKCMVEVAGKTLLEHTMDSLILAKIEKLILVVGYEAESLKTFISQKRFNIDIVFIENPVYFETNNIYSLYLAIDEMAKDDTILLESDLIYSTELIQQLVDSSHNNLVVVAKYKHWMDGTVTRLDGDGFIKEFIDKKDFSYKDVDVYYKTVNIYKFSKEFTKNLYRPFLNAYIQAYGKNQYYELVLKTVAHLTKNKLKAFILSKNTKWYEIDDSQDLDIANKVFANNREKLKKYEDSFGGYWRFDDFLDFCYLVNPFFPTTQLKEELLYSFSTLMSQYPSGAIMQKSLTSNLWGINREYVLVGNGATELLSILGQQLKGKMSIAIPTFNEYIRCFPNCTFEEYNGKENNFALNKDFYIDAFVDSDIVTIVNPDNPSGAFFTQKDIFEILNASNTYKKFCIIDESFVDFVDKDQYFTLISDDLLEKYPYLIVIKSISKSYGVPGIRLGVLATSNMELIQTLTSKLPCWNINSLGEYFLQISVKYRNDYQESCYKITELRKEFVSKLNEIPFLKTYPSQANYVMCKIMKECTSEELVSLLLYNHNILIKNLSTKNGFNGENYVRIAINSQEDNDELIRCLHLYKDTFTT